VVTAAAVIMISVFAAFIPHGSSTIKPIALGLAVGVFVDAFMVRMTLVPAVLALLGSKAWWMPKRLDKALPHIDVEGSALVRHVEQVEWEEANGAVAVRAEAAAIATDDGPVAVDLSVPQRSTVSYDHPDPAVRAALVWTLGGWRKPVGGHLAVLGRVLPEEAGAVRKAVRVVPLPSRDDDAVDVRRYVSTLLIAQSDKPWPSRRTTHRALDQAESWLSPLRAEADAQPLGDRRLGDLAPLERRLVTLSAAAVQSPELIVVAEPDRDLDPGAMSWFAGVCAELVHDTGTTVLLVGSTVTALADQGPSDPPASTSLGFGVVARSADRATPSNPSDSDEDDSVDGDGSPGAHVPAAAPTPFGETTTAEVAPPDDEAAGDDGSPDDLPPDHLPPDDAVPDVPDDDTEPRKQTHELTGQ
jgi:putative drug exporter of the RND superfamily